MDGDGPRTAGKLFCESAGRTAICMKAVTNAGTSRETLVQGQVKQCSTRGMKLAAMMPSQLVHAPGSAMGNKDHQAVSVSVQMQVVPSLIRLAGVNSAQLNWPEGPPTSTLPGKQGTIHLRMSGTYHKAPAKWGVYPLSLLCKLVKLTPVCSVH